MRQCFDIVKNAMLEKLLADGYSLTTEDYGDKDMYALFSAENDAILLRYNTDSKLFSVLRGQPDQAADKFTQAQSYLFDKEAGDGAKEANGVANEFLETLGGKSGKVAEQAAQIQKQRRKNSDSDESTAVFFVNRIPSVLPECREPLLRHKQHYERMLPRFFCEEVVVVAVADMLRDGSQKDKCRDFFGLLTTMYAQGDLDTKSIIIQVILGSITNERDVEYVERLVSEDLKKAWIAGRRWVGKNVKPEKESAMSKMAQYQADTLQGQSPRR